MALLTVSNEKAVKLTTYITTVAVCALVIFFSSGTVFSGPHALMHSSKRKIKQELF